MPVFQYRALDSNGKEVKANVLVEEAEEQSRRQGQND